MLYPLSYGGNSPAVYRATPAADLPEVAARPGRTPP
jgi:hypothetical protein